MINFHKVSFKNFGSFGNLLTEIHLDKRPMTLVCGNNGHGKSFALLDSITFALFGKPFRKINIPQLVNSVNQKDCLVEVQFSIGEDNYSVIRGLKPKKFEIYKNKELINQHAKSKDYQKMLEEQILRMNYKSFTQVVILGSSSFVPFMQLSAADRRSVIEDILDINVFSTMNTLLKERMSLVKEEIKENNRRIETIKDKIDLQKSHIDSLKERSEKSLADFDERINSALVSLTELQSEAEMLTKEVEKSLENIADRHSNANDIGSLEKIMSKVETKVNNFTTELESISKNSVCSSCGQDLPQSIIEEREQDINEKLDKMKTGLDEMKEKMQNLMSRNEEINEVLQKVSEKQSSLTELNGRITASNRHMQELQNMRSSVSDDTASLDDSVDILSQYENDHEKMNEEKVSLMSIQNEQAVAYTLLKDSGIKSKIIKHYLPIMNKMINSYLSSMDFFAQFHLDEEFNETIKSRHRDAFSYMSFSEGEKLRIDLALLLAWREIARIKNSANCNLLILDEVFDSSLDGIGTEEFMKLLHALGKKCNIFVISHKADQLTDKFPATLTFEKKSNFSGIAK